MKDSDRYLEAARAECEGLDRDALVRRVAALSRRLDTETHRNYANLESHLKSLATGFCGRTHEPNHLGEPCPYCRASEARSIFERFDRGEIYDTDALAALRALFGCSSSEGA